MEQAAFKLRYHKKASGSFDYCLQGKGKAAFIHGNRVRKPAITIPLEVRKNVVDLYPTKYFEANFVHFTELLARNEGISLSVSAVTNFLKAENIISPRATKAKKKRIKKELEKIQQSLF